MADWPTTLSQPLLNGFQGHAGISVQRTDFDSGPARQRRKFVNAPDELQVGWRFSPSQMSIFRDFFKTTLHDGTDWFNIQLNIGNGLLTYEARFIGQFDYQYLKPLWQVNAKLDVRLP